MSVLQHNYLAIQMPDGWEDASQVIALAPEDDGFRPNLIFSQEPTRDGEDAAQFAARQLSQLREVLEGYRIVSEGPAKFGSNVGFLREQEFIMDKGAIRQIQFYIVLDERNYTFTFTHLAHMLSSVRGVAEQMFASARINPPNPKAFTADVAEF